MGELARHRGDGSGLGQPTSSYVGPLTRVSSRWYTTAGAGVGGLVVGESLAAIPAHLIAHVPLVGSVVGGTLETGVGIAAAAVAGVWVHNHIQKPAKEKVKAARAAARALDA